MSHTLPYKSVSQSCVVSGHSSLHSASCLAWNCFVVFDLSIDYKFEERWKKSETWESFILPHAMV